MAASGALAPFLSAMTEIRAQRLKEAAIKEQNIQAGYAALAQGIGSFGQSIGGGIGAMGGNMAANTAMNQALPPRAQAVGPNAQALNKQAAAAPLKGQIPYSQVPATMSPHTGGMREFGLLQQMGQLSANKPADIISQLKTTMQVGNYNRLRQLDEEKRAAASVAGMSQNAKDILADSKAYLDGSQALMTKISEAGTRDQYLPLANQLAALNSVYSGRKLSTPFRAVPPFVSPEDRAAMRTLNTAQIGAQGKPATVPGMFYGTNPSPEAAALGEAEAGAAGRHSTMEDYQALTQPGASPLASMTGGSAGGAPPGAIPVPASEMNKPDGKLAVGKNGTTYRKQGQWLIPVQ